ncbi:MAG: SPOR domain-containing protein [Pseudolabrys sp.]|nr:SPOR domain-containing protein [Pseudolabrys sp.]
MAGILATIAASGAADARGRRHHQHHHRVHRPAGEPVRAPAYASIVVDANSGRVMEETNADSPRHPASLTKMMTLYLLFERLEQGRIQLSTEMKVSAHAADQAPSKLGLAPGDTIDVDSAIKAIVTKSANDVAVVVAEALGGSESEFARLMTAKARELGMMHTNYHNASGLPDEAQITTARDQAILARALQDRFPKYFHYFSTRRFVYHGRAMRNHNHLLDRVAGVDGIKTGYIHESGFNIVTSVHRGERRIIAVVFGGRTAAWRDARVRSLIEANIGEAATKRTAPMVVEGWSSRNAAAAANAPPLPAPVPPAARNVAVPVPAVADSNANAPIKPHPVKTVAVIPDAAARTALSGRVEERPVAAPPEHEATVIPAAAGAEAPPSPARPASSSDSAAITGHTPAATAALARSRGPYMIQVGALDDESDARQRLANARAKAHGLLSDAIPFTEKIAKGDRALYRARFAGLEKSQAEAACRSLKRSEIPCFLLRN